MTFVEKAVGLAVTIGAAIWWAATVHTNLAYTMKAVEPIPAIKDELTQIKTLLTTQQTAARRSETISSQTP